MESNNRESRGRVLTKAIIGKEINISGLHFASVTELEIIEYAIWGMSEKRR